MNVLTVHLLCTYLQVNAELVQEEQTRAQWRLENARRRHDYVPFIINYLKVLAERGALTLSKQVRSKCRT